MAFLYEASYSGRRIVENALFKLCKTRCAWFPIINIGPSSKAPSLVGFSERVLAEWNLIQDLNSPFRPLGSQFSD